MRVRRRRELLVPHHRRQLHVPLVHQRLLRHRRHHLPRRIRRQPAQQLLPEQIVRRIVQRRTHLPTPCPRSRQHRRPPVPVALRHQQRHGPSRRHLRQHRRTRLRRTRVLIVIQIRQLSPTIHIRRAIVQQPSNRTLRTRRRQLHRRILPPKSPLLVRHKRRKQIRHARRAPPAIAQRKPPAQKQQPSSALVHKLPQQLPLHRRKVVRLHAPDDDRLVLEQVLRLGRKPIRQLARVGNALPIYLVLRRPQHRDDLHSLVQIGRAHV